MEISRKPFISGTLVGLFISIALGACIAIVAAKAGITPAISPLVVLVGWMGFAKLFPNQLKEFLSAVQVTGSAGTAVAAGVVFSAPIVQLLTAEATGTPVDVNVVQLMLASVSGSLMGWGFVGLATPRLLADPRLPAPEAVVCDRLIQTASMNPEDRPRLSLSLVPGLFIGALTSGLIHFKYIGQKIFAANIMGASLPIYLSPIYIGIGAIITFETAVMMFSGGLLNSGVKAYSATHGLPPETFRWVGGAAMFVCVVYSLCNYYLGEKKKSKERKGQAPVADEINYELLKMKKSEVRFSKAGLAVGVILFGVLMMSMDMAPFVIIALLGTGLILGFVLSNLGGLLSLQVGSGASPVSGTVFVGLLVFSFVGLSVGLSGLEGALLLVPLTVALLVAICTANDSSQDYKTMYLNGFRVSQGFVCQLVGLLGASIVIPFVLAMIHKTQTLGSEALPIPQANFFATVLKSLFMNAKMPVMPVIAGLVIGVFCVGLEIMGRRKGKIWSSMALSIGIYLPAAIGIGALMGNLAKVLGGKSLKAGSHQGILATAGLITGDAIFGLMISFLILMGFEGGMATSTWSTWVSAGFLILVLGGIFLNYRSKRQDQ